MNIFTPSHVRADANYTKPMQKDICEPNGTKSSAY